jgi:prepilin-type processing-associated H-X9-DG protein
VGDGVAVIDSDEGGAVFVYGSPVWCWDVADVAGRRLAAVQLVETATAPAKAVAASFGIDELTLRRWRQAWRGGGVEGLSPAKRGPKGPSRLNDAKVDEIAGLRATGLSMEAIALKVGVSLNSVSRVLKRRPASPAPDPVEVGDTAVLVPLARPDVRDQERQAARRGELVEAEPRITEGGSLPLAGALVILPALVDTGLLDCFAATYGRAKAAFYGLRSLVLCVVFTALVGEARVEGLTRIDPVDVGRLLGLDRAPEPKTMRRRMAALSERHLAGNLLGALARRHVEGHAEAVGVLYVDGHVRAYHGTARIPKAHVARIRLSMPAELDTWIADANGDGLLVWQAAPGASLAAELRTVAREVRQLLGPDRRPTIAFDRGGWSPALFADLDRDGFDILTYRKNIKALEPRTAFSEVDFVDDTGRSHTYLLADRRVRLTYKERSRGRYFACRQIVRLDPATGHQTQIITTRTDPDPGPIAHAMFSRWRQENFFRYMRAHYDLDALDTYTTTGDDPDRSVPNPARTAANRATALAAANIETVLADAGRARLAHATNTERLTHAQAEGDARAAHRDLQTAARAIPARIPIGELHPDAARLDPERKRIHDAIRIATYNAESALARLLAPHYARAEDEARSLLREIFRAPADLAINGTELHVRINPLSAPRRTRALVALCTDLNATRTTYPGTSHTLVYSVKDHP